MIKNLVASYCLCCNVSKCILFVAVSLMDKMNMDKKKSKVVDVTTKKGTVETLTEAKITCTREDKV